MRMKLSVCAGVQLWKITYTSTLLVSDQAEVQPSGSPGWSHLGGNIAQELNSFCRACDQRSFAIQSTATNRLTALAAGAVDGAAAAAVGLGNFARGRGTIAAKLGIWLSQVGLYRKDIRSV